MLFTDDSANDSVLLPRVTTRFEPLTDNVTFSFVRLPSTTRLPDPSSVANDVAGASAVFNTGSRDIESYAPAVKWSCPSSQTIAPPKPLVVTKFALFWMVLRL